MLLEMTLSKYNNLDGNSNKKLVYRIEIIRKYSQYPIFEGE